MTKPLCLTWASMSSTQSRMTCGRRAGWPSWSTRDDMVVVGEARTTGDAETETGRGTGGGRRERQRERQRERERERQRERERERERETESLRLAGGRALSPRTPACA